MILGIHQPQYLPWLGIIDRIDKCDTFILLDNVPYSKNYYYNSNRIKAQKGWIWLTVPVLFGGNFGQLIKDIKIDNNQNWRQKHLKSIYLEYKKAPFFDDYYRPIEDLLGRDWESLSDLSSESIRLSAGLFGIDKKIKKASELNVTGNKEDLLIDICLKLKADVYMSGPDGKNYLNLENWADKGIKVIFQDFKHPKYRQSSDNFVPQMAAFDLLFSCGKESLSILRDQSGEKSELVLE